MKTKKNYFFHFSLWEDWKAGLYNSCTDVDDEKINQAIILLKDSNYFMSIMLKLMKEWPFAFKQQMSNYAQNRQAWLGQAACCFEYGCSSYITILAWRKLTMDEQKKANKTADVVIYRYDCGLDWCQKCLNDY